MTMDAHTGARLTGEADIAQSVVRILTTPIGTRVMRRSFGSHLADLIDTPLNAKTRILWVAATAGALRRWEPRIAVERVQVNALGGHVEISISATRNDLPRRPKIQLSIPV